MSIAVGFEIPATLVSVKPAGSVAAFVTATLATIKTNVASRISPIEKERRGRELAALEVVITSNTPLELV